MTDTGRRDCDVLIIGGGPAGSTAAMVLARAGVQVTVLERTRFPRLRVGESFLPRGFQLIQELGLVERVRKLPHMPKFGAEFGMGNTDRTTIITFDQALGARCHETFNIERAPFDRMLLDAAREDGADVREEATVQRIVRLADDDTILEVDGRELRARYVFDASGQAAVLGRKLGMRRVFADHRKVAYFGHFENVKRRSGHEEGFPTIVICDEGWFWVIPLDSQRTSIGLVMDTEAARRVNRPADQMLFWGIERCPLLIDRTAHARFPDANHVIADFSYTCEPFAGPGYFLVGDAAVFLDPIFSTGVCLGMVAAAEAGRNLASVLRGDMSIDFARALHKKTVSAGSTAFFKLINMYYDQSFRELFLNGSGPLRVHQAVISVLAGHVFPRASFAVRWRMWMFEWMIRAQRWIPLVPRRSRFSLFGGPDETGLKSVEATIGAACENHGCM